jgi:SCY1-like protein 2
LSKKLILNYFLLKQEAAVFVLQKKSIENFSKKDQTAIIDAFKKGATQLARLKHPRILSLQHQLEESKFD